MAYTDIDKPSDYFNTILYTGNGGSGHAQTGVGFKPDWVWIKQRSATHDQWLTDIVRGVTKTLRTNNTDAENTIASGLTSFDSDGFTVGSNGSINDNGQTYAAWNWLGSNTTASNGNGSITSTVSVNTTSGFSIVKYTGTGSNLTIGHGLGAIPKMIIVKKLTATDDWYVYHNSTGAGNVLKLNTTAASSADALAWQNTTPTSSLVYLGARGEVNAGSTDYIAYCFADVQGYSKFGSYTGNGNADGTFVYTGFKPAFLLWKLTNAVGYGFQLVDSKRNTFNPVNSLLFPYSTAAEYTNASEDLDLLSNGFKFRNSDRGRNGSGDTYIYMAFAENPFTTSTGVPATAR